ncbi:uncharacterized protein LOC111319352 [Stylophora pistillata]|uniref:uncharacterized protein LOC111319352 n=1 Tax=Stylophora pistillata TaxID=50429 RepID=UPI000C0430BB|nr:uncharacterized protein LOC111319352 [Stylophora pistillata]
MAELNSLTLVELKAFAKHNGIIGYSRMRKAELIRKINRVKHHWTLVESKSALNDFAKMYTIDGAGGYGPIDFLQAVKSTVIKFLLTQNNIKMVLVLRCNMLKTNIETGEAVLNPAYFLSHVNILFQDTDREEIYQKCVDKMMESLAKFTKEGSGWTVDSIAGLDLHTTKYNPLQGSSYIKLSPDLAKKKAIVNMKNKDNECFKWCVTRALNPVKKDQECITKILKKQAEKLKWDGIKFPMEVKDIHRFEKLNPGIAINVFMYEGEIYPLRVSNVDSNKPRIRLLLISDGKKTHYCLIKSMSRLLSSQLSKNEHKKFICDRCLNYFGSQKLLDIHDELCREHEAVREKMPPLDTFLFFKNYHRKIDVPFVIYADFESIIKPLHTVQPNPKKCYTEKKQKHIPVSFCYYIKCSFDDKHSKKVEYIAKSEDEDVAQIFVNMLEEEVKSIYKNHPKKEMIFTDSDVEIFENATCCWLCKGAFNDEHEKYKKVRDHCHYTGKFRGAAHNKCNLLARRPKFIPVVFHNLANYDAHLFVRNLGVTEGDIDCIPNNEEKYISFTKHIVVDTFFDKKKKKDVDVKRELSFIDSIKFMPGKLEDHVKNLAKNGESFFQNTGKYHTGEKLKLLMRKGEFPYEWMDSIYKLDKTALPPNESWFSSLSGDGITEEGSCHSHKVWKTFGMKTFRDYLKLYNQSDVLLLADVFENFRKVCKENYGLDPCWYYTAPGLAWDACLKLTKIRLELLSDVNMLHMFEKGIRGGISMIPTRYSKANNKYMGEKFDPAQPSKFITYLDANNLYGWAMSKNLPTHGFEWVDEKDFGKWKNFPCILEVDLLPIEKDLYDYFDHYPLAPQNLLVNKVKKLVCTLNEKKKYIIHHETLKLYMSLGMKIGKIHRVIRFEESPWMKPYIDLNTSLRAKADNDFEKDFFKRMNNSVYGKTMENIRKRVDIRLVNSEDKAKKLVNKVNFKHCTIFSENLCAIHMRKTIITFNKPVYLGMCILDLSKNLMYDFHYNYIKTKYGDRVKLLMTDTDSLCYEVQTDDFYQDVKDDVNRLFDTSNFPKDHPSGLPTGVNKKVIGMFKDEAGGKIIEEFVGLRAKLYCYKMFDDGKEEKKCKGVKKKVVENTIKMENYKACLFYGEKQHRKMITLRSRKHDIFTEEINKLALSANDDKRIILSNIVDTHSCSRTDE